jgi:hypothetical protein
MADVQADGQQVTTMNAKSEYTIRRYEGGYLSYIETPEGLCTTFGYKGNVLSVARRMPDGSLRPVRSEVNPPAEAASLAATLDDED